MLEQAMERAKKALDTILIYFNEDKESKKKVYLTKLERVLDLAVIFYEKYDDQTEFKSSYRDVNKNEMIDLVINFTDYYRFKIVNNKGIYKYVSSNEISQYIWEEQMNIQAMITSLFNSIQQLISKKSTKILSKNSQYETDIKILDEAINNLEEINNISIPEDIKKI